MEIGLFAVYRAMAGFIFGALLGCVGINSKRSQGAEILNVRDTTTTDSKCATGETATPFQLEPVDFNPTLTDLEFIDIEKIYLPSLDFNLLLNTCVSDLSGAVILKSLTYGQGPGLARNDLVVDEGSEVIGLTDAVFGSALDKLKISMPVFSPLNLTVRGGMKPDGKAFAYYSETEKLADGSLRSASNWAVVGNLVVGNPFANAFCESGFVKSESTFEIGPLKLEVKGCRSMLDVGGKYFTISSIHIVNSTVGIPPREANIMLLGDQIRAAVKTHMGHHNNCDRMEIKLANMHIGLTSIGEPGVTCDAKDFSPSIDAAQAGTGQTRAQVQVGSNAPELYELACYHFLMSCRL
jgi:hypothetical protein